MVNQMKTMAGKWAQEHRRKAAALRKEAGAGFALAKLQPWPASKLTRMKAAAKQDKANRLLTAARRWEQAAKKETGLGSTPKPVIVSR